jgi:RNA polymerase sigma-70 factor (ECF subfamily)
MDDTELMLRVKRGDDQAFRQIVETYRKLILDLCFRYVGNQEDAEEVAQDVFIRLYKAAYRYQPRAKLSTLLYRIAVNLSLNRIRDRKAKRWVSWEHHRREEEKSLSSETSQPDTLLENKERQQIIRGVIDSLPTNQRTAVILKRYHDLSYEEIADVMRCSVSAVEARLHRAKQNLKKQLKPFIA